MTEKVIVLYPVPIFHHIISMVELGKLIHQHHPNLSITILLPPPTFTSNITSIISCQQSISFFSLPPVAADGQTPPKAVSDSLQTISLNSTVLAFISSVINIPHINNIPAYFYFSSNASALASILHFPTIVHNNQTITFPTNNHLYIPGLPPIRPSQLPQPFLDPAHPAYHDFLNFASASLPRLTGIILNTFDSLEPKAIEAITQGQGQGGACPPSLYCIGPLIVDAKVRGASDDELQKCLEWLDVQPRRSVVLLCFGRKGAFSADQLKEIAIGLERSQQRFMWVVRNPPPSTDNITEPDLEELMPEGFLERIKDKGLVLKGWAPQAAILRHESVGGFVTHCGWNSVLEAVSYGVPMVGWPLYAEQRLNSVVMEEEMKVSVGSLGGKEGEVVVRRKEVERMVRELMMGLEVGKDVRERSLEMKSMAKGAWSADGGSSFTAFSNLVASWYQP